MPQVAVVRTSPSTYLEDARKAMRLAGYRRHVKKDVILKLNLSWSLFYPACSTSPWQLEAVLDVLKDRDVYPVENQTVVTKPWEGAWRNKWLPVLEKYGRTFTPLTDVEWETFTPESEMLAMGDLFKEGILVPEMFFGKSIVHLPTMKTHGHTTTTGAMKNAFGGLIPKYRHHAHRYIHEVLVDLLAIQQEIHSGIFTLMDGSVCGNGAGPRTMIPFEGNIIIAGADSVAVDSTAAKIMGFEPMNIPYIRLAHEKGLGTGETEAIDIRGDFDGLPNFRFEARKSPVVFFDQFLRNKLSRRLPFLEKLIFHTSLFNVPIFLSGFYHDRLWYPTAGKKHISEFMKTKWGELFAKYPSGLRPSGPKPEKEVKSWNAY
jgi:uncharacterized protein (DUF362 family)